MIGYLELVKKAGREENPVGWYHSHPGYGCWLSGIDVSTQMLQQQWQDPWLAIVVRDLFIVTSSFCRCLALAIALKAESTSHWRSAG